MRISYSLFEVGNGRDWLTIPMDEDNQILGDLLLRFDDDWCRQDSPPRIDNYLLDVDPAQRPKLLRELILIDLERRWKKEDFRTLLQYAESYPELLDSNKSIPLYMVLEQFKIAWGLQRKPEIPEYLAYIKTRKDRGDLFWELVLIDLENRMDSAGSRSIDYYRREFPNLVDPDVSVPINIVLKQFELEWNVVKALEFEDYLSYVNQCERSTLLRQLVIFDMTKHWSSGKAKWLQDYLKVYPELLESDRRVPDDLVVREKTLSVATVISEKKIRCPYCQTIQDNGDRNHGDCFNCGRIIQKNWSRVTIPEEIGDYQIIKLLGVGGYGKVCKAWDTVHCRMVAIKIPLASALGFSRIDRFRREAQIASSLDHPNIVQIYDYHIDDDPTDSYITYQYINGMILTGIWKDAKDDLAKLAKLVMEVAQAVHYAHKKRVVHRDLKPSNILIDANNRPLVSDFGLARLNQFRKNEGRTVEGQIVGTLEYMAPEQLQGREVDFRSDIYSLGVILYKLLTGRVPFRSNNNQILKKQICADNPILPSVINSKIPSELDKVCLRAIAKQPSQRYGTAYDLAEDLKRYLAGRRVQDKPAMAVKRLWSWCRWNPKYALLRATLLVLPLLICFLLAHIAITKVDISAQLTESQRKRIKQLNRHYRDVVDLTVERLPYHIVHEESEIYLETLERLELFVSSTDGAAESSILQAYQNGDFRPAIKIFNDLGETVEAKYHLGNIYCMKNQTTESLRTYKKATSLQAQNRTGEYDHRLARRIGECYMALGHHKVAQDYITRALELASDAYGSEAPEVAIDWVHMGDAWYYLGQYKKSRKCFEHAYMIDKKSYGPDHPVIARDLDRLGGIWHTMGLYEKAIEYFEKALHIVIDSYGYSHRHIARSSWHLGNSYYSVARYEDARDCFNTALVFYRKSYGPEHSKVTLALNCLGGALYGLRRYEEARKCFEEALQIDLKLHNAQDSNRSELARDWLHLGGVYLELEDDLKAEECFMKAYAILKVIYPADHPDVARNLEGLGTVWISLGKYNRARAYLEKALAIDKEIHGDKHIYVARDLDRLGSVSHRVGDYDAADEYYKKALRIYRKSVGKEHPDTLNLGRKINDLHETRASHNE